MKTQEKPNVDRVIPRAEFRQLVGIGRTTEWRLAREGKLPAIVEIDGHVLGYLESAYLAWLKQHSA